MSRPHERAVVAIAAVCTNGVIGADGDQPWRNRDDFARFKRLTMNQVLVMGRLTFEAIGRALPGRHTIVLSRGDWSHPAVETAKDLGSALALAARRWPDATVFIAGGGEIYRLALPLTTRLEITEVDQTLPGEVTFPEIDPAVWQEASREPRDGFSWVTYRRRDTEAARGAVDAARP